MIFATLVLIKTSTKNIFFWPNCYALVSQDLAELFGPFNVTVSLGSQKVYLRPYDVERTSDTLII